MASSPAPLADMELRGIDAVAFDVDDTLTSGGVLQHTAFTAMHALHDAGVTLLAVTGRPLGFAEVVARQWPVDLAIGENGAGWFWRDPERREVVRDGLYESAETMADIARRLEAVRAAVEQELPEMRLASDMRLRRYDLAFDIGEEQRLDARAIAELEDCIERAGANAVTSSVHCHAQLGSWNKARGIERSVERVMGSYEHSRWVFIGDSGNDQAAFEAFGPRSVGVANVLENELEVLPAYVCTRPRGDGFAELAERLLRTRGAA